MIVKHAKAVKAVKAVLIVQTAKTALKYVQIAARTVMTAKAVLISKTIEDCKDCCDE